MFPPPEHMVQAEAIEYLRRQVFEDAVAAGLLRPCVRKEGRGRGTVFYSFRDVQEISLMIAAWDYPTPRGKGAVP